MIIMQEMYSNFAKKWKIDHQFKDIFIKLFELNFIVFLFVNILIENIYFAIL